MTTYLVTGAAGFIGANFLKHILAKHGDSIKVIVLDALTYAGNIASIKEELELPNVTFIRGDIKDHDVVSKIFAQNDIDFVVNFAAESHVDRSIENPSSRPTSWELKTCSTALVMHGPVAKMKLARLSIKRARNICKSQPTRYMARSRKTTTRHSPCT